MKKLICFTVLASMLLVPALAVAADQIGIYVAPKFIYGYARGNDAKATDSAVDGSWSDTYTFKIAGMDTWGGSLALGYDFHKKFDIPLRAEIEYALFADTESKSTEYSESSHLGVSTWNKTSHKLTLGIQTLFLNAYYDFRNSSSFTPYVGAGIGMAFIDAKYKYKESYSDDDPWTETAGKNSTTNFAWNIGGGVAYDINEYLAVDLGYRFVGLGEAKTKKTSFYDENGDLDNTRRGKVSDLYAHQVALGLRVTF
ncbi:MAG: acyloxyacyl hydrolase [Desulfovibrio sp.]|nr:acyloxyacyl hydrolase [Desulfovibrio sp.]